MHKFSVLYVQYYNVDITCTVHVNTLIVAQCVSFMCILHVCSVQIMASTVAKAVIGSKVKSITENVEGKDLHKNIV